MNPTTNYQSITFAHLVAMDTRLEISLPQEGNRFITLWPGKKKLQHSTTQPIKKPGMFGASWGRESGGGGSVAAASSSVPSCQLG